MYRWPRTDPVAAAPKNLINQEETKAKKLMRQIEENNELLQVVCEAPEEFVQIDNRRSGGTDIAETMYL